MSEKIELTFYPLGRGEEETMEVCREMQKLREYLNKHEIKWTDVSAQYCSLWMCRTHFTLRNNHWSVINGYGSYGGFDTFSPKNKGLLELMTSEVNGGEPVGYLTADDVIKYMYPGEKLTPPLEET